MENGKHCGIISRKVETSDLFLLLIGFIFFIWMYRNIRKLKKLNSLEVLKEMEFAYLPSGYIVSAFIIMFSIAPLFDLHAPSAYIESMQFLLLVILSIICWKKWPRKLILELDGDGGALYLFLFHAPYCGSRYRHPSLADIAERAQRGVRMDVPHADAETIFN